MDKGAEILKIVKVNHGAIIDESVGSFVDALLDDFLHSVDLLWRVAFCILDARLFEALTLSTLRTDNAKPFNKYI